MYNLRIQLWLHDNLRGFCHMIASSVQQILKSVSNVNQKSEVQNYLHLNDMFVTSLRR